MSEAASSSLSFPTAPAILLGVGLGAFFDGVILHQVLQWHHFASNWNDGISRGALELDTFWDGLFHAFAYVVTVAALYFLWRDARHGTSSWSGRRMGGALLIGWGLFNLYDGLVNHLLLGIHHVNEQVPRGDWWVYDLGFVLWGAVMLGVGYALFRNPIRSLEPRGALRR